jgi:hypothetical protein
MTQHSFPYWLRRSRALLGAVSVLLFSASLWAQTVSPLIDENRLGAPGKIAKGKIEYVNDGLESLFVTLDTRSFTVSDKGELSYRPLDSNIHVKFSAMSFRILPKQTYFVFYEASSDSLPAWFVVYASFSGFSQRTAEGFKIQIQLPHTVYLLPNQKLKKDELQVQRAEYQPVRKKIVLRVQNSGPAFGRVLEADASAGRKHSIQGGFPVFPQAPREIEIPWEESDPPQKITLRLDGFTLDYPITGSAPQP